LNQVLFYAWVKQLKKYETRSIWRRCFVKYTDMLAFQDTKEDRFVWKTKNIGQTARNRIDENIESVEDLIHPTDTSFMICVKNGFYRSSHYTYQKY
jgi:hypothetical protein